MLRYQVRLLRKILLNQTNYCSTAVYSAILQEKPTSLVQQLSKEFSEIAPVVNLLKENEVKNIHFNEWKSRIYVMKKYHFSNLECFQMISLYPLLLKIPLEKFEDTIGQWFSSDLGLQNVQSALLRQPLLFDISSGDIRKRVPRLRSLFRTSTALTQLLINSPNVMYDNWDYVSAKINYLLKVRRFTMGDIMQGSALSKSLDFIKFRLDLLEKCGIYKTETLPIHKINKYDKSRHKNPVLKDILLSNTSDFSKLAKISQEEYAMCRDLYFAAEGDESDSDDD